MGRELKGRNTTRDSKKAVRGNARMIVKRIRKKANRPATKLEKAKANAVDRARDNTVSPTTMSSKEAADFKSKKARFDIKKVRTRKRKDIKSIKERASRNKARKKKTAISARGITIVDKSKKKEHKARAKATKKKNKATKRYRNKNEGSGFCSTGAGGSPKCNFVGKGTKRTAMSKKKANKVRYKNK